MAGHSQFKNIMHRKGRQNAAKSRLFGKLAREIRSRPGWDCPSRHEPAPARGDHRCPRGEHAQGQYRTRDQESDRQRRESYDEIRYEGYGPGGVAVIVEVLTDNRNRTAGEVRASFTKSGGHLAETGAVSFMFDRVGVVEYDARVASADAMLEARSRPAPRTSWRARADTKSIRRRNAREVAKVLEAKFGEARKAALVWKPQNTVAVNDEQGEKLFKLIETLNEHDDVQNVYAKFEGSDALMQKLSA